jgi:hypothetical protein
LTTFTGAKSADARSGNNMSPAVGTFSTTIALVSHIRLEATDPSAARGLDELATALRAQGIDAEVVDRPVDSSRRGLTWWEVYHFALDEATHKTVDLVTTAVLVWLAARFRHRPKADESARPSQAPKAVTLYGPDDRPLRKIEVESADSEPTITDDP